MLKLLSYLRGLFAGLLLVLNTAVICVPLFFFALLKLLIPLHGWRTACNHVLDTIQGAWISGNRLWLRSPEKVSYHGAPLRKDRWCLVTCNHQAWADIFIVQSLLNRQLPQMKFFLKQELLWVPVVGLCWWALDFPFMKRYNREQLKKNPKKLGKDLETARNACRKFRDRPVAIFNFMEGTRFTAEKHQQQNSPFTHLLKPKVAGTGLVLDVMGKELHSLVDLTIHYQGEVPGMLALLRGDYGQVSVHIHQREIPPELRGRNYGSDKEFRGLLQSWVHQLWEEKDRTLEKFSSGETALQSTPG